MTKFLNAAEEIFGKHGYEGTTIRAVTKRARVNLGTLQHYWGSKRELFADLFEQRFSTLAKEHLHRLQAIEAKTADGSKPSVGEVVRALIEPTFYIGAEADPETGRGAESSADRKRFYVLYGRALMDPAADVVNELNRIFEDSIRLFLALMRRACPQLSVAELDWRVNCILGAQVFSLVYSERVGRFLGGEADVADETASKWIIHFLMNGIDAPPFADQNAPKVAHEENRPGSVVPSRPRRLRSGAA